MSFLRHGLSYMSIWIYPGLSGGQCGGLDGPGMIR